MGKRGPKPGTCNKYKAGDIVRNHTVIKFIRSGMYLTRCVCGEIGESHLTNMFRGDKCYACRGSSISARKVIMVDGVRSSDHYLYDVWRGMIERCYNENNTHFYAYGAKGVSVCRRWDAGEDGKTAFQCFAEDIHGRFGPRPNQNSMLRGDFKPGFGKCSYHLGRKNHDVPYELDNTDGWQPVSESVTERNIRNAEIRRR